MDGTELIGMRNGDCVMCGGVWWCVVMSGDCFWKGRRTCSSEGVEIWRKERMQGTHFKKRRKVMYV